MIYICFAILCSSLINWIFRKFSHFQINPFIAILFNYFTCSILGQIISKQFVFSTVHIQNNYFVFCIILGILFIGIFYAMSLTTANFGIAVNAVASKMGLIFPAVFR